MDDVLDQLCKTHDPNVHLVRVQAEAVPDAAAQCDVQAVPLVVLYQDGKERARVQGADARAIAQAVEDLVQADPIDVQGIPAQAPASAEASPAEVRARCERLCRSHAVMVFMKGTPESPRCKFSRRVVDALRGCEIPFGSFDVLCDERVRQGMKDYAQWPTYPQLYVHGELLGGADAVEQWHAQGCLRSKVQERLDRAHVQPQARTTAKEDRVPSSQGHGLQASDNHPDALNRRLEGLVQASDVMLFMKGTPGSPQCGFSAKVVDALQEQGIPFGHYDILTDEDVRQGLKAYAQWPTFPQVYVKGQLLGGCDIVLELQSSGLLREEIQSML